MSGWWSIASAAIATRSTNEIPSARELCRIGMVLVIVSFLYAAIPGGLRLQRDVTISLSLSFCRMD